MELDRKEAEETRTTGRGTGPRKLIDDLERIDWKGRKVTVVFDSDLVDKPEIEWARWHLGRALASAEPMCVWSICPPAPRVRSVGSMTS